MIPELEPPEYLRQKSLRNAEKSPSLGLGFKKARLERQVYERLLAHFRNNIARFEVEAPEDEMRTAKKNMIPALLFEDPTFNERFVSELKPLHEIWAKTPLRISACYGIRAYQSGTFLYNHVDRKPHIVSSTICIDHALDSRWPLHIESIDGTVHQIDMDPGEYISYEGARLMHGRPYPLDGEFYAGIFVHYYPADMLRKDEEEGRE
jgi:hypothetical protein